MKNPLIAPANAPATREISTNCHIFSLEPSKPTRVARIVLIMDTTPPTEMSIPPPSRTIACPTARMISGKNTRMLLFNVSRTNMLGCRNRLTAMDKTNKMSGKNAG